MSGNWSSILIFVLIIGVLLWWLGRRGGGRRGTQKLQAAIGLISNVNDNIKILGIHRAEPQSTKKFRDGSWKVHQDKLDFLDTATVNALKETFSLVSDFNEKIGLAKKTKTTATLQELPLDKLNEPLAKSKEGLVQWLKANLQSEMGSTRRNTWGF